MENDQRAAGQRIRTERNRLGLTQQALSEAVEVGVTHISNIESGKEGIGAALFFRLAEKLGVTADYLRFGNRYETDDPIKSEIITRVLKLKDSYDLESLLSLTLVFERREKDKDKNSGSDAPSVVD